MKRFIIFVALSVCFAFSNKLINATGFEDLLRLRSKSATLNEGGIIFNKMHIKYLAGFIDGEGNVAIIKASPQKKSRGTKPRYEPIIAIVNCDYRVLKKIGDFYGGNITTRKKFKSHHRTVFVLTFYGKTLQKILPILIPHLIIKKEKAKYLSKLIATRKHTYPNNPYSIKEMAEKENLYQKCKNLM